MHQQNKPAQAPTQFKDEISQFNNNQVLYQNVPQKNDWRNQY